MVKKGNLLKTVLGLIAMMILVMGLSTIAYADDIKDVTKTVNNTCEAKALIQELKTNGITYNLTIKCAKQELVDYLKGELVNIPLATIYRPVQLELTTSNNTQNNNCNTNTQNNNCNTNTQNNNCNKNTQNNNCNTNTQNNNCNTNTQNNNCNKNTTTNNNCNKNTASNTTCNKAVNNCNTNATTNNTSTTTGQTTMDNSPKTGDMSNLIVIICVALLSVVVMASTVIIRKRRAY